MSFMIFALLPFFIYSMGLSNETKKNELQLNRAISK